MASTLGMLVARLREAKRNALMTPDEFAAMKLAKFRKLVQHASKHSPWYADLVHKHSIDPTDCVPEQFPVLTKAQLMANFDAIVTDRRLSRQGIADFLSRSHDPAERYLKEFVVIHTSGSSGEVGYFVYSRADFLRGALQAMGQQGEARPRLRKRHFGRMRLAYYAAVGGHFAGVTMVGSMARGPARLFLNTRLLEVNAPLPETIAELNEFQPDILTGYTGALVMLAAKQREGLLRLKPLMVSTAGESMSTLDRQVLEEVFGCTTSNGYGSSEHLMMGYSDLQHRTMHLCDDDLIYECHADHTLVSNLFNYTLPLIRYRMGDILRPVAHKSRPDSPRMEIESLVGRSEQLPVFLNEDGTEDFLSPHTINEIFVSGLSRFQMQLRDKNSFRFLICTDPTLDTAQQQAVQIGVEQRLREILAQKRMRNVSFTVDLVTDIPLDPRTRKFRLIAGTQA